ncbi:MAG: sigma-70 family RNA polymerase sigma factor [Clostridia bacterium]|nr:sigma-70 family RNA polymerase sigma factor [Clostridia bacterium]
MQEVFSDNQLVDFINKGEYKYLQILINRYMPYIINVSSRYNGGGLDTEDFIQEGILAIFSAVKTFDADKASFKTFVSICINRAMSSALSRTCGAAKHIPESLISSIDDVELTDCANPESILIEKEDFIDLEQTIKQQSSDFEYQVLCEFLSGKSYSDISSVLGVTEKSVDNALRRIRSKIKK